MGDNYYPIYSYTAEHYFTLHITELDNDWFM